jgi:hypothetical protein
MELKYKRLTRTRARRSFAIAAMSRSSLWLGDDHLLSVDSAGYNEYYKRFYFRDIQAIMFYETRRGINWNIILGISVTVMFILMMITKPAGPPSSWPGNNMGGIIFFGSLFLICGLFLLVNLLSGPTCKAYIRTAVQTEELPSLSRVRRTKKVLATIRPLITAAQGGQLPPDVASAWMQNLATSTGAPAQGAVTESPGVPPPLG